MLREPADPDDPEGRNREPVDASVRTVRNWLKRLGITYRAGKHGYDADAVRDATKKLWDRNGA